MGFVIPGLQPPAPSTVDNHIADVKFTRPDELGFVDPDIAEMFKDTCYLTGTPIMAQLVKELRMMREVIGGKDAR